MTEDPGTQHTGRLLRWLSSFSTNLFPRKPGQPTLDSFFQWLLGLATIGSLFFVIKQLRSEEHTSELQSR